MISAYLRRDNLPYILLSAVIVASYLILAQLLFVHHGNNYVVYAAIVILIFTPKYRLTLLAVFNLIGGMLMPLIMPTSERYHAPILSEKTALFALAYAIGLGLFYLYARVTIRWPRAYSIVVLLFLVALAALFSFSTEIYFYDCLIVCLTQGVLYNCFYLRGRKETSDIEVVNFLSNQHLFYYALAVPVPALLGDKIAATKVDEKATVRLQLQGLFVIIIAVVIAWTIWNGTPYLRQWFSLGPWPPDEIHLFHMNFVSLHQILTTPHSLAIRWLLLIATYVRWLSWLFWNGAFAVATCRMFGVETPAPVHDLHTASTMYQFFDRSNPYYCSVINDIFAYPFFRFFKFIKNIKYRGIASFAAAVLAGGLFIHIFQLSSQISSGRIHHYPKDWLPPMFYWFVIAIAIYISLAFERKSKPKASWLVMIHSLGYFILNSILLIFIMDYTFDSAHIGARLSYFAHLFHVNWPL